MKLLLITLCSLIIFASCKKETVVLQTSPTIIDTVTDYSNDSATYSIDGVVYSARHVTGFGGGTRDAFRNLTTGAWNQDSLMYFTNFDFSNSDLSAFITIGFAKNYNKQDLTKVRFATIKGPTTETNFYFLGDQKFATDYLRSNREQGIYISCNANLNGQRKKLYSYILQDWNFPTTIPSNFQDNSYFTITKFVTLPNRDRLMEAKFALNVYTQDEQLKRIENGFLRLHLLYAD